MCLSHSLPSPPPPTRHPRSGSGGRGRVGTGRRGHLVWEVEGGSRPGLSLQGGPPRGPGAVVVLASPLLSPPPLSTPPPSGPGPAAPPEGLGALRVGGHCLRQDGCPGPPTPWPWGSQHPACSWQSPAQLSRLLSGWAAPGNPSRCGVSGENLLRFQQGRPQKPDLWHPRTRRGGGPPPTWPRLPLPLTSPGGRHPSLGCK